jgi:hypothetical protein
MNELTDLMWRLESLLIMSAVWALMGAAKKVAPKFMQHAIVARLLPLVPIALCSGAVWIPGLVPAEMQIGPRIMLGVLLGTCAGQSHKILKQTGMGKDTAIESKK